MKKLLISLFISLLTSNVFGATYYINPTSGNDGNNGASCSTPFKTPAGSVTGGFGCGDTLKYCDGTYTTAQVFDDIECTSGNEATVGVVTADGATISCSTGGPCLQIKDSAYLIVDGLNINGNNSQIGVRINDDNTGTSCSDGIGADHITLQNMDVVNCEHWGIGISQHDNCINRYTTLDTILVDHVEGNTTESASNGHCVKFSSWANQSGGTYGRITNSTINDCYRIGIQASDGWNNMEIDNNTVTNASQQGANVRAGIRIGHITHTAGSIHHNTLYSTDGWMRGIEVDEEASNIEVYNNEIYNTQNGILLGLNRNEGGKVDGVKVYNNIVRDSNTYEVRLHFARNIEVYNNTLHNEICLKTLDGEGLIYKNNICYADNDPYYVVDSIVSGKEPVFDYNVNYRATGTTYVTYNGVNYTHNGTWMGTGQDANSGFIDPAFNDLASNDFTLSSSSWAIDKGLDLSSDFTTDFNDNTRSGTWDIGAYEYGATTTASMKRLTVSDNDHYIVDEDGNDFFLQADTAWQLVVDLSTSEIETYLDDRKAKGFNAVMFSSEWGNLANYYGDRPFTGNDISVFNSDYWDIVDFAIEEAAERDMYVYLFPFWARESMYDSGDLFYAQVNPTVTSKFTDFATTLGARYKDYTNVVWILGGDYEADDAWEQTAIEELAKYLAYGINGATDDFSDMLITYHPIRTPTTSDWFHTDTWMMVHSVQTGHRTYADIIDDDWALTEPTKPTWDSEPRYENIWVNLTEADGTWDDEDVRNSIWRSLFQGGYGITYGANEVWQFCDGSCSYGDNGTWEDALDHPGASQMKHITTLMTARPYTTRVPFDTIIASDTATIAEGTGDASGKWAMIYISDGSVTVDRSDMAGTFSAYWYNPRTGYSSTIGTNYATTGTDIEFTPSDDTTDWVLVLDTNSEGYSAPGINITVGESRIGKWELDETSGTTVTDQMGNYDGTASADASTFTTTGYSGSAYSFNATAPTISMGDVTAFDYDDPMSVAVAFKTTNTTDEIVIFSKLDPTNSYHGWQIDVNDGKVRFFFNQDWGTNTIGKSSTSTYYDGEWHYVVATYDGNNSSAGVKLYIDDAEDTTATNLGTASITSSVLNSAYLRIGGRGGATVQRIFDGEIDQVILYNKELNSEESSGVYNEWYDDVLTSTRRFFNIN